MTKVIKQETDFDSSLVVSFDNGITLKIKHPDDDLEYYQYANSVGTVQFTKHSMNGYSRKQAIQLGYSISLEDWENPNYLKNAVVDRCINDV